MKLSPLFTDHAILPANKPLRVFGEGTGEICVTLEKNTARSKAENGQWLVDLPPMPYGGPYELTVSQGEEKIVLKDIYIGEVYLISGQSNFAFKLNRSNRPAEEYESDEKIRLFSPDRTLEDTDYFHTRDGWVVCDKKTAGYWSAIGYELAHCLRKKRDVAVGLIACYQGASAIEGWLPEEIAMRPEFDLPIEKKHWDHTAYPWNAPAKLYDCLLSLLFPYPLTGVIWYQGESDTTVAEAEIYAEELLALIGVFRKGFKDDKLPVTVIQIADYDFPSSKEGWVAIQKAQLAVAERDEAVNTIVSRDLCETNDIHPPTKSLLAQRIADSL